MHGPNHELGTSLLCLLTCFVRASSHYGNSVASSLGEFFPFYDREIVPFFLFTSYLAIAQFCNVICLREGKV